MLEELHIRGLGVIDDAVLPFGPGLTAVTGETGAGKTMVVTGLQLLFGGRADSARIRAGAEQASVDGRLEIRKNSEVARLVRDAGGELDDGTGLVLRRVVSAAGRSRAHAGGAAVPVAALAGLAQHLVVVHGQHDQQRLAHPAEHRAALDRFAGLDLGEYHSVYAAWRDAEATLHDRTTRMAELRREADLLEYGIGEIDSVAPEPGEDLELTALAARLAHADGLRAAARAAHDLLLGDAEAVMEDTADVAGLLGAASRALGQHTGADPQLDELAGRLVELADAAADIGAELGTYTDQLDADPERLEQVESRRAELIALIRKYGSGLEPDLGSVLQWRKQAADRLVELDVSDEAIDGLTRARDAARIRVDTLADQLSKARQAAASRLAQAVTAELSGLAMPSAQLAVTVQRRRSGPGPDGADDIEFLFQAHPSSPQLPLARSASGGELSRVMLALELCLAGSDPLPTMVFDEIDAGIGGRAALEVGRRLARLARSCQVVVVTHLAQVAAFADRQIVVNKAAGSDGSAAEAAVTVSDVRVVDGDLRVAELARMLAGSDSATAREHAAELLKTAASERRKLLKK